MGFDMGSILGLMGVEKEAVGQAATSIISSLALLPEINRKLDAVINVYVLHGILSPTDLTPIINRVDGSATLPGGGASGDV